MNKNLNHVGVVRKGHKESCDSCKKVKTGIKTKGMSGKPIATEAPCGYVKAPNNKDFGIMREYIKKHFVAAG